MEFLFDHVTHKLFHLFLQYSNYDKAWSHTLTKVSAIIRRHLNITALRCTMIHSFDDPNKNPIPKKRSNYPQINAQILYENGFQSNRAVPIQFTLGKIMI